MSVAALVLEDGGDEDEAIAALLHDALKDCGDRITAEQIEERFGRKVRSLVEACTDTPPDFAGGSKPPWRERKEVYISLVVDGHGNRISLADKLHNARAILRDHRADHIGVWDRRVETVGRRSLELRAEGYAPWRLERVWLAVLPWCHGHLLGRSHRVALVPSR